MNAENKQLSDNKGVLVLYTGGTIGSMPADPNDPESPQRVVDWDTFLQMTPQIDPEQQGTRQDHVGFRVNAWSLDKALDSCNITPQNWQQMAEVIYKEHNNYEGFVVVHGTDTMVYTASALSFMLINLKKPVILTGSQLSHTYLSRNDGLQNLITAINFANPKKNNLPVVPEVCIFFGKELLRGNRCRKKDAEGFDAYFSPNYPALGRAGAKLEVFERNCLPIPTQSLQLRKRLSDRVITFDVFPGIQNSGFAERLLDSNHVDGVVLRAFGSGNIPTDPKFLEQFKKIANAEEQEHRAIVQNVTQCVQGKVSLGVYETSAALLEVGMVTGFDITPEAAVCKQMVLLGDEDLDKTEVAILTQQSMAGEMSQSLFIQQLKNSGTNSIDSSDIQRRRIAPAEAIEGNWESEQIDTVVLRLYGAEISVASEEKEQEQTISIDAFVNLGSDDDLDTDAANYAGTFKRRNSETPFIVSLDLTKAAKMLIRTGDRISATVAIGEGKGKLSWQRAEIAVFINESSV